MKFIKFGFYSLAISSFFLGFNQTSVSAFTLDLFTDAEDSLQSVIVEGANDSGFDIDNGITGTDLGRRRLDVSLNSSSVFKGQIAVAPSSGLAFIASDPLTTISSAKFTWGSDSTTPQDITTGGTHDSFLIDVLSIDLSGATFTFLVEDSGNDTGSISQPVNSTGNIYFPYETLTNNFPDVDQTSIREVSLEVTGAPANFDASFNFIQSASEPVPFAFSPSLGLILCGGLFGIGKLQKKLKDT